MQNISIKVMVTIVFLITVLAIISVVYGVYSMLADGQGVLYIVIPIIFFMISAIVGIWLDEDSRG